MKNLLNFVRKIKPRYALIIILALVNVGVAFFYIETPFVPKGDSFSYMQAMEYIKGVEVSNIPYNRILTSPLFLLVSIFFGFITGTLAGGMLIWNFLMYALIIFVFYKLAFEIYSNHKIATLSSILFFSEYCMFNFGIAPLSDISGWFFFILGSYFAIKYYKSDQSKFFYFSIFAATVGIFFKETGALGIVTLGGVILISKIGFKDKIKKIFLAGLLFSVLPVFYHLYIYLKFGYLYIDWYSHSLTSYVLRPASSATQYGFILLIKVLGWLYSIAWIAFLFGLWREMKEMNKERILLLLVLLLPSLSFLAWPALTQRIAFVFVPWLSLIAGFGLAKIKNYYILSSLLIAYLLINFSIETYLIKVINLF